MFPAPASPTRPSPCETRLGRTVAIDGPLDEDEDAGDEAARRGAGNDEDD